MKLEKELEKIIYGTHCHNCECMNDGPDFSKVEAVNAIMELADQQKKEIVEKIHKIKEEANLIETDDWKEIGMCFSDGIDAVIEYLGGIND